MNKAINLGRSSTLSQFISQPYNSISRATNINNNNNNKLRFVQLHSRKISTTPDHQPENNNKNNNNNMDDEKNPSNISPDKPVNVMEDSFGEGYATRSDEEGFGGVYGGNDELNVEAKHNKDPVNHDSSQGSHVQEKEKGRNQTQAH